MRSTRTTALVGVQPSESVTRPGHGRYQSGGQGRPLTPPPSAHHHQPISISPSALPSPELLLMDCLCLNLCLLFTHLLHKKSLKAHRLGQRIPRDEASVLLVRSAGWHFQSSTATVSQTPQRLHTVPTTQDSPVCDGTCWKSHTKSFPQ